jgi:hypothetical protein
MPYMIVQFLLIRFTPASQRCAMGQDSIAGVTERGFDGQHALRPCYRTMYWRSLFILLLLVWLFIND